MRKHSVVIVLALAACAPKPADEAAPPAGEAAAPPGAAASAEPVLPFLADDYPAALAEARERDLPVFIESWAPW